MYDDLVFLNLRVDTYILSQSSQNIFLTQIWFGECNE